MEIGIVCTLFGMTRATFSATKVATAAATTAAVAPCDQSRQKKACLGPWGSEHKIGLHILLPKLLRHVETQGAVRVINGPFRIVRQNGITLADFLKLDAEGE